MPIEHEDELTRHHFDICLVEMKLYDKLEYIESIVNKIYEGDLTSNLNRNKVVYLLHYIASQMYLSGCTFDNFDDFVELVTDFQPKANIIDHYLNGKPVREIQDIIESYE